MTAQDRMDMLRRVIWVAEAHPGDPLARWVLEDVQRLSDECLALQASLRVAVDELRRSRERTVAYRGLRDQYRLRMLEYREQLRTIGGDSGHVD